MRSKGFTLAEVLITLLIIGVISSIVIPGLINSTNDAEYNTGVKKIYADLSAATKAIQINNGETIDVGTSTSTHTSFRNEFCNVMSCIQKGSGSSIFGSTNYKLLNGGNWGTVGGTDSSAMLNNGILIYFNTYADCGQRGVSACGEMWIDINGRKGPNKWGKDMYIFYVVHPNGTGPYTAFPSGTSGDISYTTGSCLSSNSGYGCAYPRLTDPDNIK
jgi:prepilin-type N-terminal cleavage/methylation domain-containing protein